MLKENAAVGIKPRRLLALLLVIVMVLGVFSVRLFQIQIVQGEDYAKANLGSGDGYSTSVPVAAARGEIVDCNQVPLVVNRTSYAVVLDYNYFPHDSTEESIREQNECLLALTEILQIENEAWNDSLPISKDEPYAFEEGRESGVARLKEDYLRMAPYATAEECMRRMVEMYHLSEYTAQEQRTLAGIHYEMVAAGFSAKVPYTFAGNVSDATVPRIVEKSRQFPGVDISTVAVREYVSGTTACHIIGTVGPIYAEEYDALKEKGYSYNDILGKSGIEAAAEQYLRGTSGSRELVKDAQGSVLFEDESKSIAPVPGQTVVLTLDAMIQQKAQDVLSATITDLRENGEEGKGKDIKSGSVVLLDVSDGGVLTSASWPDYDLSTYKQNYNELIANPDNPLFNRALNGAFACGSVFKPGMALAAITSGFIDSTEIINCTYAYDYYAPSYIPKCMSHHGKLSVITAIEKSCNYFFYDIGRLMGSSIFNYLSLYGFGQKTGVEIGESSGVQQTKDTSSSWVAGDYLQLAIGQRGAYTPIQLAAYTMMIANKGVRYKTHFIKAVRSYDNTTEMVIPPEEVAKVTWSEEAIEQVRKGMIAVGQTGTAKKAFADAPYTVACKTGTAQTGIEGASDHGTFIAYAPAENPEVAISVVLENGNSAAAAAVAREVLDAYFEGKDVGEAPTPGGELIP